MQHLVNLQFNSRMLWSCLIHAFIVVCSLAVSSSNETDRLALLTLKSGVTNDPFGALSSWNDSVHYCQWNGITCSLRHVDRVIGLDLGSQKLEGMLSPYVGNLSFLREFVLTMNNFYGPIPQEVGRLVHLQSLALNNNSFSGEIPSNLSYCSNLRRLSLVDNLLSGRIPIELTSLTKLNVFAIAKNRLRGTLPPALGNLSYLTKFDAGENNYEGSIPYDICRIRNMTYFNLQGSNLSGDVPVCLFNQSYLTEFSIATNQLTGELPLDIGVTLPHIQALYLGQNNFTGPIPVSLSNASRLGVITFEVNGFSGSIPVELGRLVGLQILSLHTNELGTASGDDLNFITSLTNCSLLEYLSVSKNSLKGSIPNSIANLSTQLTRLYTKRNQIHGSIPSGFENLVSLSIMDFGFNLLTGTIPSVMGMLPNMRGLYLDGNQLSGAIPDSFNNSTLLTSLSLGGNKLEGRIPRSLGNCQNLFLLGLYDNNLNGTIPEEVIGRSSLKLGLSLSNNALSGTLPSAVGNLTDLTNLDVSRNRLSGSIPGTIGNCLTLEYLNMEGNFFEGEIPESLKALKGITYLDLSHNKLSGQIPDYLENFTSLTYLNLSFNELEGPVPRGRVFKNASIVSIVGNNKLCGTAVGLNLLPCHTPTSKDKKSLNLKVVIPVVAMSTCLVLLSCLLFIRFRRRMSNAELSTPSSLSQQFMRISFAVLLKATNNFSEDNLLGVGSYGSVYKAILAEANKIVAVKVFNLQQRGASKSFLSECNALRNLRHRNLVKIITACSSVDFHGNDFKALVFEFMPNGSLEEWIHPKVNEQNDSRNLNFLQRLNIAIDVAVALDHLHHHCQPTIVHCDLKPSNVLLDDDMSAHVADFGLAKIFTSTSSNSSEGQASSIAVKGTIGYLAPEYGMGGEVSVQGDAYSYGIFLLEMFTGTKPTDDMFQDGRNLHDFCKIALPEQVMNIVDSRMLLECNNEAVNSEIESGNNKAINTKNECDTQVVMQKCLVSTVRLGVACSVESPNDRMDMGEVIIELYHIRDRYQGVRVRPE